MLSNKVVPRYYGEFRQRVLSGEIPVNYEISLEMNRIDHLIESPEYYYDDKIMEGFIEFCETELTLPNGDDLILTPSFKLWSEALLAWYYFIEEEVYDHKLKRFVIKKIKKRLVNKQFLIVSRSNAKTIYAGIHQAFGLCVDPMTTHQITTAPTIKQTEETLSVLKTSIARSKGPLFKFLTEGDIKANGMGKKRLASTKKGIQNFITESMLESRTMSIDKLQGLASKYNSIDEWLSGKTKENVIDAIEQGAAKIFNYWIIATSSEGLYRGGIGDSIKMELHKILKNELFDPHTSIWHYKLDNIDEISDPDMWVKANPNIGITVSYDTIRRDVIRAQNVPDQRNEIIAKRFGIPLEGYTVFFKYEETLLHNKKSYNHMLCALGADLSQGDDFCAFTFLFPLDNGKFGIKSRSYVTQRKVDKLPQALYLRYKQFVMEGSLIVMDDYYLDMVKVYNDIQEHIFKHQYQVLSFGYDPYNASEFIEKWISENSQFGLEVVRQGARTESVPLGELKILAEERMLLFDEELFKFSMENAIVIEDNNKNRKLSKKRSEEKIDNVAALLDAFVAYKRNQEVYV